MDASSGFLNHPTRSRLEFLEERIRDGKATTEEYREWVGAENKEPFRSPLEGFVGNGGLRGSAAVGAAYIVGLDEREKRVAEGTLKTLSGIQSMLGGR
jgi:hypothetical protein